MTNIYWARQAKLSTITVTTTIVSSTTATNILPSISGRSRCVVSLIVHNMHLVEEDSKLIDVGIGLAPSSNYGTGNSTRIIQSVTLPGRSRAILADKSSPIYLNPGDPAGRNNLVYTIRDSYGSASQQINFICSFVEFEDTTGNISW